MVEAKAKARDEEVITKIVVISDTELPSNLALAAYKVSSDVTIKETCFGLMVTGKRKDVDYVIMELRKLNPYKIFSKERGFPPGDPRRCRADRGGGPRPGFHQLKCELDILPDISKGLILVDRGSKPISQPVPKNLDVDRFKEIIDEETSKKGEGSKK
ncbi:methanogenesis marker 6 protein [Methanocella sp. CWC-04]|uniref:Methanogenesis marker 6 protein n=1 Tax=Methanooceanicella nereidis TaxID=2052831 RepID=A0AAP2W6V7_9EURY|nr:methanogenesis marker 6 protein [Methanocella sp. CWC-04]MCD1295753.1 methanogenesis marker 6 protein [Methanocella sp. CWC-04]